MVAEIKGKKKKKFFSGGPGSQKGSLVEELINEYDFKALNVEDIVYENLPFRTGSSIANTLDLQDTIKVTDLLLKPYIKQQFVV